MEQLPDVWPELSLGERLRWRRLQLGLTRAQVAQQTGISVERQVRLEADRGKLAPAELLPLLAATRLAPGEWLQPAGARVLLGPYLQRRLELLHDAEIAALERFVLNLTAGRGRE